MSQTPADAYPKGLSHSTSDAIRSIETFYVRPRWLFVRVETDKGVVGWGEATLEGRHILSVVFLSEMNTASCSGHTEAVEGAFVELRERFVGWDCANIEDIWQTAYRHRFYRGGEVLMSAISGYVTFYIQCAQLTSIRLDIALWFAHVYISASN
jgi:galactonate dehydratase